MKIRVFLVSLIMASAIAAGTAFAQPAPNPAAEAQWQRFLANHPTVEAGLVNNPSYLAQHPGMAKWLEEHPDVAAYARRQGQIGGWDRANRWHDRDWWVRNDPGWVRDHHPEWAEQHPAAQHPAEAGEWDEHHHWRVRSWWMAHHPNWVRAHHPEWYESEHH